MAAWNRGLEEAKLQAYDKEYAPILRLLWLRFLEIFKLMYPILFGLWLKPC